MASTQLRPSLQTVHGPKCFCEAGHPAGPCVREKGHVAHVAGRDEKDHARAYFDEISLDQRERGTTGSHVPIVIWDFNAGQQKIKDDWDTHQSFWIHLAGWAAAEGEEKRSAREVLSRALETAVLPGPAYYQWRDKPQEPDPVEDTSDTELDGPWCPGLLASPTELQGVIVGSRVSTRRAADEGAWPFNNLGDFWRPVIMERLRAAGAKGVTQQAVDLLCRAVEGDYQALFHATQLTTGNTEPPSRWYAIAVRRAKESAQANEKGSDGYQ